MKLVHSLALVLAVTSLLGFRSDDTFTLKHKVKKDEVLVSQRTLNLSAEESEILMDMKIKEKVLSVEEDGAYEIEESLLSGTLKVNGEEQAMDKDEPKATKYDKNGKEIKKEGAPPEEVDPVADILNDVLDFEPKEAVKIGDTWKHDGDFGVMEITLESREKVGDVDCLKITLKGKLSKKDTVGDVTGTFYIRADDFSPEKMEAKIENPKVKADASAMKLIEIKMTRATE